MTLVQLARSSDRRSESVSLEAGMNFAAVLAESRGAAYTLPPPPKWTSPPADLAERAHRALYEVSDPEFPISLVDLGLIYDIVADEKTRRVTVSLTFTATACPCTDFIKWDIRERLLAEPGIETVEIDIVWDPPWTTSRVTERGRRILERAGIALVS